MKAKRHYEYVIQDKYMDEPWLDHSVYRSIKQGKESLDMRRNKFTDRQWRMVRRCITETILAN